MEKIIASRRGFLMGAVASLLAAPAIVRASSLMKVKAFKGRIPADLFQQGPVDYQAEYRKFQTAFLKEYHQTATALRAKGYADNAVGWAMKEFDCVAHAHVDGLVPSSKINLSSAWEPRWEEET